MKYKVLHETDIHREKIPEKFTKQPGKYYVMDFKGNVYGKYVEYDDALDHADTLNEMEEL